MFKSASDSRIIGVSHDAIRAGRAPVLIDGRWPESAAVITINTVHMPGTTTTGRTSAFFAIT